MRCLASFGKGVYVKPSSIQVHCVLSAKNWQVLETFQKKYPNDPINLEDFGED